MDGVMLAKLPGEGSLLTCGRVLQMGLGSSESNHIQCHSVVKCLLGSAGDRAFVKHNMNL